MTTDRLSDMLDDFDDLRRGRITKRAPHRWQRRELQRSFARAAGRGMFHGITFAPYNLADGGPARWDEIKEQIGERT